MKKRVAIIGAGGIGFDVADALVQHDLDASPLFAPMEVPLLGAAVIELEPSRVRRAAQAGDMFAAKLYEHVSADELAALGVLLPNVHIGTIASGDQFVSCAAALSQIAERVPGVLCVEMEGAAVGQVAYEHGVPLTVVRVISDDASEGAHVNFQRFIDQVASRFTAGVVRAWLADDES